MIDLIIGFVAIAATCSIYFLAKLLHQKLKLTFTVPVVTSTFIVIILLLIFKIPYETFMIGGQWIKELQGPAVVALAYPLYKQRDVLKKHLTPILLGSCVGVAVGISAGILLAKAAGFEDEIILSLTTKSVTMPVAVAIVETLGGVTSLAAVFVLVAGFGGVFFSSMVYKLFRINDDIAKSVGLGSGSHAIGIAKALESSLREGSISTIAMIVCAVTVSIIAPWLVQLLLY